MSDNTQELREKVHDLLRTVMVDCDPYFKPTEDVFVSLIKSQTNQAVLEALDRVEKEVLKIPECNCKHARYIIKEQRQKLATLRKELTQEVQTDE